MRLKLYARLHFKANAVPIWVLSRCQISLGSRFNYVIKKVLYLICLQKDLELHGYDGGDNRQWRELFNIKTNSLFLSYLNIQSITNVNELYFKGNF